MAQLVWRKDLDEPGIVAEYIAAGGVRVLIHNGAYVNASKAERMRRKDEAMRVAQKLVDKYCAAVYAETGTVPTLNEIKRSDAV